ncbi:serine/threonine-protein kinase [Actinomadura latina]|uniref:Serine/threonine protein kinase n=1 Tax=Actinomadura latina TaxID=163603 RepID=A0A846Z4Y2_9ACTN|nr:protein kinase [Actinomadura latina]NKZ06302.1 serine/threonine protein kinase [Actinomadura latina]
MTARKPLTSRDPESIGGHRLIERLGEGGQGIVYLAEDETGGRVALKVLHDRGGSRDAFLKEIAAARKVASFCTAEILHAGEDDGLPYVVTEFIDGPSLRELVEEKGPQAGPTLYRLAIGTATALAAIHRAGIVHRDFKPGNVLVGPDGPRVIDFGVARFLDATVTASSTVIGTPSYMAPEQLAGDPVGPAADVFAWGATIAYAANGRPPYGQDTIPAVMNRIVKGKPDLGGLSGPLRDLVAQALHKDAPKRPHSRDILLRLLEHSQGPIAAPEALAQGRALAMADDITLTTDRTARWATVKLPLPNGPAKRPVSHRTALAIGALTVVALLAGTAVMAAARNADERPRSAGASPFDSTSQPTAAVQRPPSTAPRTGPPTTPAAVGAAIDAAVSAQKSAAFTAEGRMGESADAFDAEGTLYYQPGKSTNYNLEVRTELFGDLYTDLSGPRIILLGNCAYFRASPRTCQPIDADSLRTGDNILAWAAAEVRWVSSPYNIVELLRKTPSLRRSAEAGRITYRGTAAAVRLVSDGPVAPFYRAFGSNLTQATYTLVTGLDHLPERLEIDLSSKVTTAPASHSLYSVTYRDWGKTGTITRSY